MLSALPGPKNLCALCAPWSTGTGHTRPKIYHFKISTGGSVTKDCHRGRFRYVKIWLQVGVSRLNVDMSVDLHALLLCSRGKSTEMGRKNAIEGQPTSVKGQAFVVESPLLQEAKWFGDAAAQAMMADGTAPGDAAVVPAVGTTEVFGAVGSASLKRRRKRVDGDDEEDARASNTVRSSSRKRKVGI